mmetsp:Transcript_10078/g.16290  ORF Transcript_10078/g.16290 Transcript_10078/m.16290 type:complete len:209 (-) Transcript_10078:39-665(-)
MNFGLIMFQDSGHGFFVDPMNRPVKCGFSGLILLCYVGSILQKILDHAPRRFCTCPMERRGACIVRSFHLRIRTCYQHLDCLQGCSLTGPMQWTVSKSISFRICCSPSSNELLKGAEIGSKGCFAHRALRRTIVCLKQNTDGYHSERTYHGIIDPTDSCCVWRSVLFCVNAVMAAAGFGSILFLLLYHLQQPLSLECSSGQITLAGDW